VSLSAVLADPARRAAVVADVARLVEREVASRGGLSGMALRAGYAGFQRVMPDILPAVVDRLLPHFAAALDPLWDKAVASGDPDAWFRAEGGTVADALLGVTDAVAARATNRTLVALYRSLRGQARPHVVAAAARLPALLRAHVPV
jgi:hypothetical protein